MLSSRNYYRIALAIKSVSNWIERIGLYYFNKAMDKQEKGE